MTLEARSSEYLLPLADPGATLETVGGKGASLARLVAAGLPVPDGFHVTTVAYNCFVAENNLQPAIAAALGEVDVNRPETLEPKVLKPLQDGCLPFRRNRRKRKEFIRFDEAVSLLEIRIEVIQNRVPLDVESLHDAGNSHLKLAADRLHLGDVGALDDV